MKYIKHILIVFLVLCGIFSGNSRQKYTQNNILQIITKSKASHPLDKDLFGRWEPVRYMDIIEGKYVDMDTCDFFTYIVLSKSNNADPRIVDVGFYDGCNHGNGQYRISPDGKVTNTGKMESWTQMYCEDRYWFPRLDGYKIALDKRTDGQHYMYAIAPCRNGQAVKGDTVIILKKK